MGKVYETCTCSFFFFLSFVHSVESQRQKETLLKNLVLDLSVMRSGQFGLKNNNKVVVKCKNGNKIRATTDIYFDYWLIRQLFSQLMFYLITSTWNEIKFVGCIFNIFFFLQIQFSPPAASRRCWPSLVWPQQPVNYKLPVWPSGASLPPIPANMVGTQKHFTSPPLTILSNLHSLSVHQAVSNTSSHTNSTKISKRRVLMHLSGVKYV